MRWSPRPSSGAMIADGRIVDAPTLAAYALLRMALPDA